MSVWRANLKRTARDFIPPVVWRHVIRNFGGIAAAPAADWHDAPLFGGKPEFLSRLAGSANVYGEYGVGLSSVWVSRNTTADILAVDTSREWIARVSECLPEGRATLRHVSVGDLVSWGRPRDYRHRSAFEDYVSSIWTHDRKPDLVLVDGRFRVACFLKSLLEADEGARIVFDDYTDRPQYHVVEEFAEPEEVGPRQGLFVVNGSRDVGRIRRELDRFLYVVD